VKSTTIPQETLLGPRNQLKTQCPKLLARKSILFDANRTRSIKRISGKTTGKRIYLTVQKPIRRPLLLHQKEKQRTTTCPGLPKDKRMDSKEPIPPSPHPRTDQSSKRSKSLFKIRRTMGVQQCPDQRRRRMEGSLHHQSRVVRTKSNVLWTDQLSRNVSSHDERHLQRGNKRGMGIHLYGRHLNPH
jgi:hypothetical protein